MNITRMSRRSFLAGVTAGAVVPSAFAASKPAQRRILFDVCNRTPLAGVRMRLFNTATGKTTRLRTDTGGRWDISALTDQVNGTTSILFRVDIAPLTAGAIPYAGMRHWFSISPGGPGAPANRRQGKFSLVPLAHPGISIGLDDAELSDAWPQLLYQAVFSSDRLSSGDGEYGSGPARVFTPSRPALLFGESLDADQQAFIEDAVREALPVLSDGTIKPGAVMTLPAEQEPFSDTGLSAGAITFVKRATATKTVTFRSFSAPDENRIDAACIFFDFLTIDGLFRDGAGDAGELALARHIVFRACAEALGYHPTLALPGRTVLDAAIGPGVIASRPGLRPEDLLLARVLYGSGWITAGVRFNAGGDTLVSPDPRNS